MCYPYPCYAEGKEQWLVVSGEWLERETRERSVPAHRSGRKHRGRSGRAISDLFTPSLFTTLSPHCTLSPTIPVHTRNTAVSPIIPVHTQKQGGGGCLMSELSVPSDQGSGSKKKADHPPVFSGSPPVYPERSSRRATRHSPLTLIITAALATAAQRVVAAHIFTTTLSIDVGGPTISLSRATEDKLKNRPEGRPLHKKGRGLADCDCGPGHHN